MKQSKHDVATDAVKASSIRIADIVVEGNFRDLNLQVVDDIAKSLNDIGLLNPLTVYRKPGFGPAKYSLVAGQHRLEAVKKAGWDSVTVLIVGQNQKQNEKRRLVENVLREDLDPREKGRAYKELMAFYTSDKGGGNSQPHDKGVSKVSKAVNKSRSSVRESLSAAEVTDDALAVLKAAGLDTNQKVCAAVGKKKPGDQVSEAKEIVKQRKGEQKAKATKKLKASRDNIDGSQATSMFKILKDAWKAAPALRKAWKRSGGPDRDRFVKEVLEYDKTATAKDDWADEKDDWADEEGEAA